jgi:hypothetical protein
MHAGRHAAGEGDQQGECQQGEAELDSVAHADDPPE